MISVVIIALLVSVPATTFAQRRTCSTSSDCGPPSFFDSLSCDQGVCMPSSCSGLTPCSRFNPDTFCPTWGGGGRCIPRLGAGSQCSWSQSLGQEQPCTPGIICSGFGQGTCVQDPNTTGVTTSSSPSPASTTAPSFPPSSSQTELIPSRTATPTPIVLDNNSDSDVHLLLPLPWVLVLVACSAALLVFAISRYRQHRRFHQPPRPTLAAPKPAPAPVLPFGPETSNTSRPYGSRIEEHVEYVTVGQPIVEFAAEPIRQVVHPRMSSLTSTARQVIPIVTMPQPHPLTQQEPVGMDRSRGNW